MKKSSLFRSLIPAIATSLLLSCANVQAVEMLPTFNDSYYQDGKLVEKHIGKLVSIEGTVKEVKPQEDEKAIILVTLFGDKPKDLWVASLAKITPEMLPIGNHVKILGYFDETKNEPEHIQKLTKDREYLLGFCFHDMNTGMPGYFIRWLKQCVAWESGENIKEISQ